MEHALPHWRAAYGLAAVLVGDRSLAEDLCQEAFLRLAALKRPITEPERIKPYLMKIIRNLAAEEKRRPVTRALETEPPQAGDAEQAAATEESLQLLRRALQHLDPLWREVLYLRDGLGFSYAEIAEATERSVDVVRVTLHRARLRMRDALRNAPVGRLES